MLVPQVHIKFICLVAVEGGRTEGTGSMDITSVRTGLCVEPQIHDCTFAVNSSPIWTVACLFVTDRVGMSAGQVVKELMQL